MKYSTTLLLCFFLIAPLSAQGLLDQIPDNDSETKEEPIATIFKSNRLLLGQSVKSVYKGELNFVVMHNFGAINTGLYDFFGLDGANTSIGLDYGVTNKLTMGAFRSTYQKSYQIYAKQALLEQSSTMPLALSLMASANVYGLKWPEGQSVYKAEHRLIYMAQVLVARKFTKWFSLQLSPTYIHKNLVALEADKNDILLVSGGGRIKVSNRTAIVGEFSYIFPNQIESPYQNYLGIGVNLDTGGHIFQLRLSNATSLFEPQYMTSSQSKWLDGDIHFGFTINRRF